MPIIEYRLAIEVKGEVVGDLQGSTLKAFVPSSASPTSPYLNLFPTSADSSALRIIFVSLSPSRLQPSLPAARSKYVPCYRRYSFTACKYSFRIG